MYPSFTSRLLDSNAIYPTFQSLRLYTAILKVILIEQISLKFDAVIVSIIGAVGQL